MLVLPKRGDVSCGRPSNGEGASFGVDVRTSGVVGEEVDAMGVGIAVSVGVAICVVVVRVAARRRGRKGDRRGIACYGF